MKNNDELKIISNSGIPHSNEFEMKEFFDVLFRDKKRGRTIGINGLRTTNEGFMTRQTINKRGLSSNFFKMRVQSDSISCTPLTDKNGQFL